MRCSHCAVGYTLQTSDPTPLPMDLIYRRLVEVPNLKTISITGGEPMFSKKSIKNVVKLLLKYAFDRGINVQINYNLTMSLYRYLEIAKYIDIILLKYDFDCGIYVQMKSNITLSLDRYLEIAEYIDVMHISHNWGRIDTFTEVGFGAMQKLPPLKAKLKLYDQMLLNTRTLSEQGMFISAETMLNKSTQPHLNKIHNEIVYDMKCQRHEIHPMYPADFASQLEVLSLREIKETIHYLLDHRHPG